MMKQTEIYKDKNEEKTGLFCDAVSPCFFLAGGFPLPGSRSNYWYYAERPVIWGAGREQKRAKKKKSRIGVLLFLLALRWGVLFFSFGYVEAKSQNNFCGQGENKKNPKLIRQKKDIKC